MLAVALLLTLSAAPAKAMVWGHGDSAWDEITDNFATDLAPLLTLFGEQMTKQFLSHSTTHFDSIIFAVAPVGIITTMVSLIRVQGTPFLRSLIGRSREPHGTAEVEICSSTSTDVCEMWSRGGVCRVLGMPMLIEFMYRTPTCPEQFFPNVSKTNPLELELPSNGVFATGEIFRSCYEGDHAHPEIRGWKLKQDDGGVLAKIRQLARSVAREIPPRRGDDSQDPEKGVVVNSHRLSKDSSVTSTERRSEPELCHSPDRIRIPVDKQAATRSARLQDLAPYPNLALNLGTKEPTRSPGYLRIICFASGLLQISFFVFTTWATWYHPGFYRGHKDDPHLLTFYILCVTGTVMVFSGMAMSAFLINQFSVETHFVYHPDDRPRGGDGKSSGRSQGPGHLTSGTDHAEAQSSSAQRARVDLCQAPNCIFWLQAGGQTVGDQRFKAFAYNQEKYDYFSSCRDDSERSAEAMHRLVIGTTVCLFLGWVAQFVGLRGLHASVGLYFILSAIIMSVVRAMLRSNRLSPASNNVHGFEDLVQGHEIDWQTLKLLDNVNLPVEKAGGRPGGGDQGLTDPWYIADESIEPLLGGTNRAEACEAWMLSRTPDARGGGWAAFRAFDPERSEAIGPFCRVFLRCLGSNEPTDRPGRFRDMGRYATGATMTEPRNKVADFTPGDTPNPAFRALLLRQRLSQITSQPAHPAQPPSSVWDPETKQVSTRLQGAIEEAAAYLFSDFVDEEYLCHEGKEHSAFAWTTTCWMENPDTGGSKPTTPHVLPFSMKKEGKSWKIDPSQLEAALGLWSWSLKLLQHKSKDRSSRSGIDLNRVFRDKRLVLKGSDVEHFETLLRHGFFPKNYSRDSVSGAVAKPGGLSMTIAPLLLLSDNIAVVDDSESLEMMTFHGQGSLLNLLAQDLFSIFVSRATAVFKNWGKLSHYSLKPCPDELDRSSPFAHLHSPYVQTLAQSLVTAGLATTDEALVTVSGALFRGEGLLQARYLFSDRLSMARAMTRHGDFQRAGGLTQSLVDAAKTPDELLRAFRACGETQRIEALSMRHNADAPKAHNFRLPKMLRIHQIYKRLLQQHSGPSIAFDKIDELTKSLTCAQNTLGRRNVELCKAKGFDHVKEAYRVRLLDEKIQQRIKFLHTLKTASQEQKEYEDAHGSLFLRSFLPWEGMDMEAIELEAVDSYSSSGRRLTDLMRDQDLDEKSLENMLEASTLDALAKAAGTDTAEARGVLESERYAYEHAILWILRMFRGDKFYDKRLMALRDTCKESGLMSEAEFEAFKQYDERILWRPEDLGSGVPGGFDGKRVESELMPSLSLLTLSSRGHLESMPAGSRRNLLRWAVWESHLPLVEDLWRVDKVLQPGEGAFTCGTDEILWALSRRAFDRVRGKGAAGMGANQAMLDMIDFFLGEVPTKTQQKLWYSHLEAEGDALDLADLNWPPDGSLDYVRGLYAKLGSGEGIVSMAAALFEDIDSLKYMLRKVDHHIYRRPEEYDGETSDDALSAAARWGRTDVVWELIAWMDDGRLYPRLRGNRRGEIYHKLVKRALVSAERGISQEDGEWAQERLGFSPDWDRTVRTLRLEEMIKRLEMANSVDMRPDRQERIRKEEAGEVKE